MKVIKLFCDFCKEEIIEDATKQPLHPVQVLDIRKDNVSVSLLFATKPEDTKYKVTSADMCEKCRTKNARIEYGNMKFFLVRR